MKYLILILQLITCFLLIGKTNAQTLECNCGEISLRTVNAKSGLILRGGPSTKSVIITTIPFGEKVLVGRDYELNEPAIFENIQGYWVKAIYHGREGYLFDGFLNDKPAYDIFQNMDLNLPLRDRAPFIGLFAELDDHYSPANLFFEKMEFDTVDYLSEIETNIYAELKINDNKYPMYVFTGLENKSHPIDAELFEIEEGFLYPGSMRTVYFSGSNYTLYATGEVVKTEPKNSDNGQTMTIKNYEVILERRSPDAVQSQVIMSGQNLPVAYWGNGGIANIRFVGDLDGDAQPDFIIENYFEGGFETSLFLSSEAEKGFLVKLVRRALGSCC